jgi:hypothetical protein
LHTWRPLTPSLISYCDIASHIWCTLANPEATTNATWKFSKEFEPITAQRVYGEFSGCEWWEEADAYIPEIRQHMHYLFPVSIFIDGAHLDNLCRICAEPVMMELLALSSKVIRTDINKILLGVLPPHPFLTTKKNEEAKSQKTKHNQLAFYHKALKIVLKDFLYLEKNKDGLQVDIPGLGIVYLHVRLALIFVDIMGQNPMVCHYGAFAANIKISIPVCDYSTAQADILERKCNPTKKEDMDDIIYRCSAAIKQATHGTINNASEELTAVSKIGVVLAFREFSFGKNPMGI